MKIGFTGTRHGMNSTQLTNIRTFILTLKITELHHGDCIGADAEFHSLGETYNYKIIIHPPTDESLRAFKQGEILPKKPYLARNRDIVDQTDLLISAPPERFENKHGGTWYTIHYARKQNKPLIIFYKDGRIIKENYEN